MTGNKEIVLSHSLSHSSEKMSQGGNELSCAVLED